MVYIDDRGDQVRVASALTLWTITADTAAWGADAVPMLTAGSSSAKGDTAVTCTISDDQGNVLASQTKSSPFAGVSCVVYP